MHFNTAFTALAAIVVSSALVSAAPYVSPYHLFVSTALITPAIRACDIAALGCDPGHLPRTDSEEDGRSGYNRARIDFEEDGRGGYNRARDGLEEDGRGGYNRIRDDLEEDGRGGYNRARTDFEEDGRGGYN